MEDKVIYVADESIVEKLLLLRPGQKLVCGYEFHPLSNSVKESELATQLRQTLVRLDNERRILRFVVRNGHGRFSYVALGVTPAVYRQVEAMAATVELPPILKQIRAKYAVGKKQ